MAPSAAPVALQKIRQLKVVEYNVLSLGRRHAQVFLETDPDVAVLEEVKSKAELDEFSERYLGGRYQTFLVAGNDQRGIQIGFLVKKNLPFQIEERSYRNEIWRDVRHHDRSMRLFSRDLPALIVRAPGLVKPLFILIGTHYKSKRSRDNDPESSALREAQVERTADIIGRLQEEFGEETPILLAGDFNGEMNQEPEFQSLHDQVHFVDSFDELPNQMAYRNRVTHTYHPNHGSTEKRQIDAILLSPSMSQTVLDAHVYRYHDAQGHDLPLPDTFAERKKNPSDHFPVLVTLDFMKLLAMWKGR